MNNAKVSLAAHQEEAKAAIRNNLAQQFPKMPAAELKQLQDEVCHDLDLELTALPDDAPAPLTGDAELKAIKNELKNNPDVDETLAAPELATVKLPPPYVPETAAELAIDQGKMLAAAKNMTAEKAAGIAAVKITEAARNEVAKAQEMIDNAFDTGF